MINIFRGYVRTKDKKPIQKFKGVNDLLTLKDVENDEEYAGILNDDFVVLDVDDSVEAEKTFRLVDDLGLNCRVVNTTRGKHFIFKKNPTLKLKGTTHNICSLGFNFDIRIGVNQYIIVKSKGKVREVIKEFDEFKEIEAFPKYFAPISSSNKFTNLTEGDGRNGKLFSHIPTLIKAGYTKEEVKQIIRWINSYYLLTPLSEYELSQVIRDEAFSGLTSFNVLEDFGESYKPKSFSELGMAELFYEKYKDVVRYNKGTDWLVWNGQVWEINELAAQNKYVEFLHKVKKESLDELNVAYGGAINNEAKVKEATKFINFVTSMESANKISSVLKIARGFMEISISELDKNPFDLNTPKGIIDLRTSILSPHNPTNVCTKITSVSASDEGKELWEELLSTVTLGDKEYQKFLQVLCGATTIGRVFNEALVIAHGDGHNGKSTMFNVIFRVLGNYSGKIPAESLTTKAKNTKVDLAELFSKRFILASETEEGQRLSNQMLKQIASTDAITGEKKYHDPFVFEPTHTALLYTNFLPRLGSLDNGTKRRIIICPFNAKIKSPKKDFADQLYAKAGGYVLKWLVEGAREFISNNYNLPPCKATSSAKEEYISENDWLASFIDDCCVIGDIEQQGAAELYKSYKQWCIDVGNYAKSSIDFSSALEVKGFKKKKTNKGWVYLGLSLSPTRTCGKNPNSDFL